MKGLERARITERGISLHRLERATRSPFALLMMAGGIVFGPGAIIHAIELIEQGQIREGALYAAQGTLEVAVAGTIAVANIRQLARSRPDQDPQSSGQSDRK